MWWALSFLRGVGVEAAGAGVAGGVVAAVVGVVAAVVVGLETGSSDFGKAVAKVLNDVDRVVRVGRAENVEHVEGAEGVGDAGDVEALAMRAIEPAGSHWKKDYTPGYGSPRNYAEAPVFLDPSR